MSEVATRGSAPRSRGSFRGGRGGHSSRGGRGGSRQSAFDKSVAAEPALEDQGEIGQLKSKYASSIKIVQEMFPQFSSEDIVFAIEDCDGDLEQTIHRMTEGNVSQWEVTKKDKTKISKPKDTVAGESTTSGRGGRGRGGSESVRGGRGRATERGRGAPRAARGGSAVSSRPAKTVDTATADTSLDTVAIPAETANDNSGWGTEAPTSASPSTSWEVVNSSEVPPPTAETAKTSSKPDGTRTWASIMKPAPKPKPVPAAKQVAPPVPQVQETPAAAVELEAAQEPAIETPPAIPAVVEPTEQVTPSAPPSLPPSEPTAAAVAPSEDKLTEENLELVKDTSHPVDTDTVASTIGTEEPRSVVGTPLHGTSTQAASRPGLGGFATSALKATSGGSRASSFRRVKDQQEAVVMPGNHAVDRTAVQFGSLGLSGSEDVDDDREEAETRAQPPQHSPIAPRASLPAVPQQAVSESAPTPRAAPGLPSDLPQVTQAEASAAAPSQASYDQFSNRFGGLPGAQAPGASNVSKPYEPFGQQLAGASHHPFDNYSSQSHAPGQQGLAAPSNLGGFGSGYDNYYNDYQRNAHLYGGFGQQGQASQESSAAQRAAGAFGSSAADPASQYATSQAPHNRFAGASEALNSGHSTPAPAPGQPAQQTQGHNQSHHLGAHGQAGGAPYANYGQQYAGYNNNSPFSYMAAPNQHQPQQYGRDRPAFDDARRYEEQQQQQQQQQHYMSGQSHYGYGGYNAYGNGPYTGGKYGQPHQYGASYDSHGASAANTFGRDPSGTFGYGRAGSTQPETSQQGQHGASAYGSMNDPFGRSASGFPGQTSQQSQGITGEENSRFGVDSGKIATGGPSPVPAQQRPDSTTNASQSQPPQGQQGYNNYPHNLGGFGSAHQGGHQGGYGGFGGGAGYANYSYGSNNRGGWGGYGAGH